MQLHRVRERFGVDPPGLVLIGQATPRQAAHFRRTLKIDLPVLADEARTTYRLAGAKRASLSELLGPRVVAQGLRASVRSGVVQGRIVGDATQLGGAMVIRADGTVAWSAMSRDASDNASPVRLLAALHDA